MSWLLHSRFRDYLIFDNSDVRGRTPILGGGQSKTAVAEPVDEPPPAPVTRAETQTAWIDIEMVGEDNKPISGVRYEVAQSDGKVVARGQLDKFGFVRAVVPEKGNYLVSFPDLDREAWEKI